MNEQMSHGVARDVTVNLNALAEWIVVQAIPTDIEIRLRAVAAKIERIVPLIVATTGSTQTILGTLISIHGDVIRGHLHVEGSAAYQRTNIVAHYANEVARAARGDILAGHS